jgi:hypothetical protein
MRFLPLLVLAMLTACVTPRPEVNSVADAILVASADIESSAQTVKALCGNLSPGGPCAEGAPISTDTKERLKSQLQQAQDSVVVANRLLAAGQGADAADNLAVAEAIIVALKAELARRAQ